MHTADSIEAGKSQRETVDAANSKENSKRPWLAEYQFKPGQSGNPNGRPKKDFAADFARMVLEAEGNPQLLQRYAHGFSAQLCKGNAYTFKELAERGYGKLVQRNEVTGKDGGPLAFKEHSDAELDERVKQLEIELGYARAIDEAGGNQGDPVRAAATAGEAKD